MSLELILTKLETNLPEEASESITLLLRIVNNIIKYPLEVRYRILKQNNPTFCRKIKPKPGCIEFLQFVGFHLFEGGLILRMNINLEKLMQGRDALIQWKKGKLIPIADDSRPLLTSGEITFYCTDTAHQFVFPKFEKKFNNTFLNHLDTQFHFCLRYTQDEVKIKAKKLIPIHSLSKIASENLQAAHVYGKKNQLQEPHICLQDMLIVELLNWFKNDFFSWVDSPACEKCLGKSSFDRMSSDPNDFQYTKRVELHKCQTCHNLTKFPRYDDLHILLETRRGRCGEWANVFTLFCLSMGWDARYVMDVNDHVWTEVYSIAEKRWIHCDPCENNFDKPLIYESGWKKKISYVIAFSEEEIQDVTWRYSSNHKEVLKQRTLCRETELIDALVLLRKNRQSNFSLSRKQYLTKRLALELAEMLTEREPDDNEQKGRQSGSDMWRLARGESSPEFFECYTWKIDDLDTDLVIVRYSTTDDEYECCSGSQIKISRKKWESGCYSYDNVFRKEEHDWRQVYLARKESNKDARISWKFEFSTRGKVLDTVTIEFGYKTFQSGVVVAKIVSGNISEEIPALPKILQTSKFAGKESLEVQAILSNGDGDLAWQHTQLFRQETSSEDYPFLIKFSFKKDE